MTAATTHQSTTRYIQPGWFTTNVFNRLVAFATRCGLSVWGSRVLRVRGRSSGEWRETPVNLLDHEGAPFLVAPRGVTQWVRNLRAAGEGELVLGRRHTAFEARELSPDDPATVEVLRAYLRRWKAEVGMFFDGVDAASTDEELRAIATDHPVFAIDLAS